MPEMSLEPVEELGRTFPDLPDDRPQRLRDLNTDAPAVCYRFFYELTRLVQPRVVFEIGTCAEQSAAHLAAGAPKSLVITLDIRKPAKELADRLLLPNRVAITCDSLSAPDRLKYLPEIDLLFIDGEHTLAQAYGDYRRYRPFVADRGLMFFDDIRINAGMQGAWERVADPKVALETLHYTGFGAACKDPRRTPCD